MTVSFNLTMQPWIPCLADNGMQVELSLSQCFAQAHELRELGGESPLVTVALYRLLLAILHRVHQGPESRRNGALGKRVALTLHAFKAISTPNMTTLISFIQRTPSFKAPIRSMAN